MTNADENLPTDPKRVRAFASFFKNYMSVSSIVVAALPIPVTALGALPTFADHKSSLSTYTSLFCFLALGFIFYMRHSLARWMFPEDVAISVAKDDDSERIRKEFERRKRIQGVRSLVIGALPFLLILATGYLVYLYHYYLDQAVFEIGRNLAVPRVPMNVGCENLHPVQLVRDCDVPSLRTILDGSYPEIPYGFWLRSLYIGMFVAAEAAFILMATREYIQDLLKLSDVEVISGRRYVA